MNYFLVRINNDIPVHGLKRGDVARIEQVIEGLKNDDIVLAILADGAKSFLKYGDIVQDAAIKIIGRLHELQIFF